MYCLQCYFWYLDKFKSVNDSYGHSTGDLVLIETGKRIRSCIREIDTVARIGGDEYMVLLEDLKTQDDITCMAQRIQSEILEPFFAGEHEIHLSASLGAATSVNRYQCPEEMIKAADREMYQAKRKKKN